MVVPGGFEPPSQAPKAFRIDHYPTGLPMLILLYQDKLIRMTYIWSFHETTNMKTIDPRKMEAHHLLG